MRRRPDGPRREPASTPRSGAADGAFVVADLGSTNGTLVNEPRDRRSTRWPTVTASPSGTPCSSSGGDRACRRSSWTSSSSPSSPSSISSSTEPSARSSSTSAAGSAPAPAKADGQAPPAAGRAPQPRARQGAAKGPGRGPQGREAGNDPPAGADADRPRGRVPDQAWATPTSRSSTRGSVPPGRDLVRRGPRLDERHVPEPAQAHRPVRGPGRRRRAPGEDDAGAEGDEAPRGRRAPTSARCARATRTRTWSTSPCSSSPTAWAATGAATSPPRLTVDTLQEAQPQRGRRPAPRCSKPSAAPTAS